MYNKIVVTVLMLIVLPVCAIPPANDRQNMPAERSTNGPSIEPLIRILALREHQIEGVKTILEEQHKTRVTLMQKNRAEHHKLHEKTLEKLGGILDTEQIDKFIKFSEKRKKQHQQRHRGSNKSLQPPVKTDSTPTSHNTKSSDYPIVDTGQNECFNNIGREISCTHNTLFPGQDGAYQGHAPHFINNGDGTITDQVSGLMWQQDPGVKQSWNDAVSGAAGFTLAGHNDWRMPTIKELYSLINFSGKTSRNEFDAKPYIDIRYFIFSYGDSRIERYIDAQYWSSTEYTSTTMRGDATVFGVNFADGRIKGYPKFNPRTRADKLNYAMYVRGNTGYGSNLFIDNGNQTITDQATHLIWMQSDSGTFSAGKQSDGKLNWQEALTWCDKNQLAGRDNWRLPNAKELQSIVDYNRAPDISNSAAINPMFSVTAIVDEVGNTHWPFYWTSTTHLDGAMTGSNAIYVAFGEALGYMQRPPNSGNRILLDVHGAGAQRSDPKSGNPAHYPYGRGPQGDMIRTYNFARCVTDEI